MLRVRKEPAGSGSPSDSTGIGSHEGDSPTTGRTSPSSKATASPPPITEGSPTISPTSSRTEHTTERSTTIDSGTTESLPKPPSSPSTSNVGAPTTDTRLTPATTTEHPHESSSSLTTSTARSTTSTTDTHPSDSSSSSTTPQPEQTSTTSSLLTTSKASTTTRDTRPTPTTTTEQPHDTSGSLTTSTAGHTTSTIDPRPSDSSSSSTISQPGRTPTTSNLLTTPKASTTTIDTQPTPTTAAGHPSESSSSLTTSKVESTTHTQDSRPPLPSSPPTTSEPGQTRTTGIQTTTSSENSGNTKPLSSPLTTPQTKPTPTTDSHSTPTTTESSGSTDPPPEPSNSLTTSTAGHATHGQPTTITTVPQGTTASPPESPSTSTTSQVGQPAPTTAKQTDTAPTATATGPKTAISIPNPLPSQSPTSPGAPPGSTQGSSTNSIHNPIATSDSAPINSSATTDPPRAGSTSQNQPAVTASSPDGGQKSQQSAQPSDPRPGLIGTAVPASSADITTPGFIDINNANSGPTPTETSSDPSSSTQRALGVVQTTQGGNLTTFTTTGVETFITTSTGYHTITTITSLSSFTSITTSLVTGGPAGSTFASSKDNKAATIAGGIIGGVLGLLLIIAVIFFSLRKCRRGARNDVLYGPVAPRGSSPGEVQAREIPPIRTVTPLLWPQDLPHASNESLAPVPDDGRGIVGSSNGEVVTNPFKPTPSTHKLVDVDSVRSSRNSRVSNPFEDTADSYLAGYPRHASFDAAGLESGTLRDGQNGGGTTFSPATVSMMAQAQANHGRHLSNASTDCLYPVLEPNSPMRRVSVRSELSYATLDPERVANLHAQQPLTRHSSTSSTSSSSMNVGYAI